MAQTLIFKVHKKPVETKTTKVPLKKRTIDEGYKMLFSALFRIKDKDVQRRVLQAINGQDLTCSMCATKLPTVNKFIEGSLSPQQPKPKHFIAAATQTLQRDFEFLEKANYPLITKATNECMTQNKVQLGRTRRKFEPYAVKTENIEPENAFLEDSKKMNYLINSASSDSLLNKIRKPNSKAEVFDPSVASKDLTITEHLLLENLVCPDEPMSPHSYFNFQPNEKDPLKVNFFIIASTMEEEMRTASMHNEGGLYPIHAAIITGDMFKLKRQLVIYKYRNLDVNIRSNEGKRETPLHYAITSGYNDAIDILLANGADVLAMNESDDTVLHFAAEYVRDPHIFRKLINLIGVDDLSKQNDNSKTILHVAAIHENYKIVREILKFIDEKLGIESIGNDITSDCPDYIERLHKLHADYIKTFLNDPFTRPWINPIKAKIINQQDNKTGRTALFLSLDNKEKNTSLMLIAHFADTRIAEFSGLTCAMYSSEVLRNRILAQAIFNADAMHNAVLIKPLKKAVKKRHHSENRKRSSLEISLDTDDDGGDIMAKVAKVFS